jgi:hypothetical protein
MALKAQEVKDRIASGLTLQMITEGFTYKKSTNEYKRTDGDYTYFFRIEQVLWSDHYSIDVHLEINQKKIETVVEKILGKQRHKFTIGADIGRIKLSPDGRTIVNGGLQFILLFEGDIEAAIETLYQYYTDIAKPYFKKYSSLDALDDIMNNEPFAHCPAHVGGMFYERCLKGLIVAKLVGNPRYDELVAIYNEEIKETFNEEFITTYKQVRDYLATHAI